MNGGSQFDTGGWQAMWCAWIGIAIMCLGILLSIPVMLIAGAIIFLPGSVIVALIT